MKYDQFELLEPGEYGLFRSFFQSWSVESCERSWANLLLYSNTYFWRRAVIENRLWIASFEENYLFFPLGAFPAPEELKMYYRSFQQQTSKEAVIGDVPEAYVQKFPQSVELLEFEMDMGEADYIYNLAHLQSFAGSKLRKRHNQVRQFEREYENLWHVEEITFDMLDSIIEFAAQQSSAYWSDSSGLEEKLAFDRLKCVWQLPETGLAGIALFIQNALIGFSIYSPLNDKMVDIHFEKADHAYRGCGAKLTAGLVDHLLQKNYSFMNREQDLNSEGLRRAKQALDPEYLYKRFTISAVK
ncbi:MAG: DUF2156 domain-containing protein [Lentisphaeria bacterium]|nr:DUF2156 domain-containing protein [Lentisphaeria bacterium]